MKLLSTLSTAFAALLAACAVLPPDAGEVPVALQAGDGHRVLATLSAHGVQIYECRAATAGAAPAWAFVAPEATLTDRLGRRVGDHGAGPSWTADDGSRIVGSVRARADAPRPSAIPWLLLSARSTGAPGRLSPVTLVQRLHTEGGLAPADGCDVQSLGRQARVPYRADYRLFEPA
jgi:hypothetical protein